ncbi:unnamed protein product [Parajaminaea phylloscopi]
MRPSLTAAAVGLAFASAARATPLALVAGSPSSNAVIASYDGPPSGRDYVDYQLQRYSAEHPQVDPPLDTTRPRRDSAGPGWVDPAIHGGSMLDLVGNGLREPINAIISGDSDPEVLTEAGLRDYVRSIGFSFECLDLHRGGLQHANLGDGAGWQPELFEYRSTQGFDAPGRWVGACWESWNGGDHFRVWRQNGSEASTNAWFLAVSNEKNLRHRHTIAPNGYNEGRDMLVANALAGGRFGQRLWKAEVEWVEGLMPAGSDGINHGIAIDGRTAVLTVQRYWNVPMAPVSPLTSPLAAVLRWAGAGTTSLAWLTSRLLQAVMRSGDAS